jgi:hypothetical protein
MLLGKLRAFYFHQYTIDHISNPTLIKWLCFVVDDIKSLFAAILGDCPQLGLCNSALVHPCWLWIAHIWGAICLDQFVLTEDLKVRYQQEHTGRLRESI